jgi:hypothetical protein
MPLIEGWLLFKLFVGIAAVTVFVINYKTIINWFRAKKTLKQSDKNNIAFTLKQELENGNYNVCQGIFNTETEELLEGVKWEGKQIDEELANKHQGKPLVVYS